MSRFIPWSTYLRLIMSQGITYTPNHPPIQWVQYPHFQLIFSHSFTYPNTQSHTHSRNQYHIHYPNHPTIQILTPSHSPSFIQQLANALELRPACTNSSIYRLRMENQWEHYRLKFDIFCTFLLCLIEGLNHKCIPMKLATFSTLYWINRNVWISIDLTTIINKIVHMFVDLSKLNMEFHCYPLNATPNIAGHSILPSE